MPVAPVVAAVLMSRDHRLIEAVQSTAAAVGAAVQVLSESEQLRLAWANAPLVLVGADSAAFVAALGLGARRGIHVAGMDAAEVLAWSVPLEAPGLVLPAQSGFLSALLGAPRDAFSDSALMVRVVGGSGGVGASTLAAALAQRAAHDGSTALVELDPFGGGIDLMFGAEVEPGWRWADLRSAAGNVGDLHGRLPSVNGVDLVSRGRPGHRVDPLGRAGTNGSADAGDTAPSDAAVRAVVRSLARSHQMVVLDAGCGVIGYPPDSGLVGQAKLLLVVGAEVRAVVSARSRVLANGWQDAQLVVRTGPGMRIDPAVVQQALGLPMAGVIGADARLASGLENGEPPGRVARRRYTRQVSAILAKLRQAQVRP